MEPTLIAGTADMWAAGPHGFRMMLNLNPTDATFHLLPGKTYKPAEWAKGGGAPLAHGSKGRYSHVRLRRGRLPPSSKSHVQLRRRCLKSSA